MQITIQDKSYAVSAEDKIAYSRTGSLFQSYKDFISRYCSGDKHSILCKMKPYAELFETTFKPEYCLEAMPAHSGIERMNVLIFGLKNSTIIPYILYIRKNVTAVEEAAIFSVLESYLMRRIVVRVSTKNYNRLFTSLILNEVLTADNLKKALKSGSESTTYIPDDDEVKTGFLTSRLTNLQSKGVLYFLESAIRPSASSTALLGFNQYSLEHLMPKKWRNNWGSLTEEGARERDKTLLTLGNLAIITSSLNSSIRDAEWPVKKAGKASKAGLVACSGGIVTMNDATDKAVWNENEINARGKWLAEQALEIWK